MPNAQLLEVRGLTKIFPGVTALDNVDVELYEGEVLGICGENGSGKSTLIKCLSGVYQPSSGTIKFMGKEVQINNENDGLELGISVIYQELSVIRQIDIAQNVFLGRLPQYPGGLINLKQLHEDAAKILKHIGLHKKTTTAVGDLTISAQQMVEIAKAISRHPKVLIMDEPTSSLGADDTERLFELIKELRNEGYGIIFISHHMEEIFKITDRVFVLRDGKGIDVRPIGEWNVASIVRAMVNRDIGDQFPKKSFDSIAHEGPPVLEVDGLNNRYVKDISFNLRKGEILGLAGIVGAGRSEVLKSVFGYYHNNKGTIKVDGKEMKIKHPKDAIRAGIGYMSEDRKQDMLSLLDTVWKNYSMPYFTQFSKLGLVNEKKIKISAQESVERYSIKTPSLERPVVQLSGGNQQKVIFARITHGQPNIYFLDEPTRGIDVNVKQEMYREIIRLAEEGNAVVLITSELPELLGMADRILVMRHHTIVAELLQEQINEETVMHYATGGSEQ